MRKNEFLSALRDRLSEIPAADVKRSLEFYGEMIDDGMEDGYSEENAVAAIGTPDEIARRIISELPLSQLVKAKVQNRRSSGAGEILLLILGAPLWIPLLLTAAAVMLAIYIFLWSVVISLYAVSVSSGACVLAFLVFFFLFLLQSKFVEAAALLGFSLIGIGLGIALFIAAHYAAIGLVRLVPWAAKITKKALMKKEVKP